jgi:hypothetical protein
MLTIDPIAIEKRLESPDALVISGSASTIDAADVDELPPRGRLQQEETSAPLHRQKGRTDVPLDPSWVQADVRVMFALDFVSMPCGTVIVFVSEIRPLKSDSPDYGYDEALGTETSFLSRTRLQSNCSGASQGTAEASSAGSDRLRISTMAAHAVALPTANVTSRE